MTTNDPTQSSTGRGESVAGVDPYWLPLGAGGRSVRLNGRVFEAVVSRLEHRPVCDLYHSALEVRVPVRMRHSNGAVLARSSEQSRLLAVADTEWELGPARGDGNACGDCSAAEAAGGSPAWGCRPRSASPSMPASARFPAS
jgi:hypothetical protein